MKKKKFDDRPLRPRPGSRIPGDVRFDLIMSAEFTDFLMLVARFPLLDREQWDDLRTHILHVLSWWSRARVHMLRRVDGAWRARGQRMPRRECATEIWNRG